MLLWCSGYHYSGGSNPAYDGPIFLMVGVSDKSQPLFLGQPFDKNNSSSLSSSSSMLANNLILEQLLMDRHQILVLILSEVKEINQLISPSEIIRKP